MSLLPLIREGVITSPWNLQAILLHLHEIMEGLYFHLSLSVCLCVCLSVRFWLWTKFQPNGWTDLNAVFAKWLLTALAPTLLKLVTLGQRSRSQWRNIHFSFIILFTSLLWIAAMLCPIKMKFSLFMMHSWIAQSLVIIQNMKAKSRVTSLHFNC